MANQLAVIKTEVFDKVEKMVRGYVQSGRLSLPANYSPENAMRATWLKLQECTNTQKKPVLETCTKASIINALQSMLYQGLNPDKNQCYFIAYGDKLTLQRSYFGSMHVARMVDPSITDIFYDVVYEGDEFEYGKTRGRTVIIKHVQKLQNVDKNKIVAAYCSVMHGEVENTTILTMDEIKAAWRKSAMKPVEANGNINPNSTHGQFTKDMAIKTVVNHACKYIINSSDDKTLLEAFQSTADDTQDKADIIEADIEQNANALEIDIEENPQPETADGTVEDDIPDVPEDVDF